MTLNLSWVTSALAVGGRFAVEQAVHLAGALGIDRVVDLREEDQDDERVLRQHGILLLHLPTPDCCALRPEAIAEGVAWVNAQLADGHKVLIHCEHGIGRSALLATCVLVAGGATALEALTCAKDVRPQVSPSPEQLQALLEFSETWSRAHSREGLGCDLDALCAVAYRHLK